MNDRSTPLPALDVPALLRQHQIELKKSLGQNFLTQPAILRKIVQSASLPATASVLEIGAGLGTLTRELAAVAQQVVALELDDRLIPLLNQVLSPFSNVTIVHGDILETPIDTTMPASGYYVVANIPYYITSAVFRKLLEASIKPVRIVLTVQQEVAERICAPSGKSSLLSLSVQVYGTPRSVLRIPAGAFYPNPRVDSQVLVVDLYDQPMIPSKHLPTFFRLAKAGFTQKRKMLRNSLAAGMQWQSVFTEALLDKAGIDPQRRAETLDLAEWRVLSQIADEFKKPA